MPDIATLEAIGIAYLALVIAKTILCYASAFTVMSVLDRLYGKEHHTIRATALTILVPFVVAIFLPKFLYEERFSFFALYSRRKLIRDMLIGAKRVGL